MVGGGACEVTADCGPKEVTAVAQDPCEVPEEGCITRTPGFWCTHPTVTDIFLDPPLNVCGLDLNNVMVATSGSAIEDLIVGKDHKGVTSPQQLQLIRQCTAAALNQAASLDNEGDCGGTPLDSTNFGDVFDDCCNVLCTSEATGTQISESGCIELLDQFNNSTDTLGGQCVNGTCTVGGAACMSDEQCAPAPFNNLGQAMCPVPDMSEPELTDACSAQSARCSLANDNGFVNPRDLGPGGGGGPPNGGGNPAAAK